MTHEIQDGLPFEGQRRYGRAQEHEFGSTEYLKLCGRQKEGAVQIISVKVDVAKYTVLYREELKAKDDAPPIPVEPQDDFG